jgi:hypothetical protein
MMVAGQDPQLDRQAELAGGLGISGRLLPQLGQLVAADVLPVAVPRSAMSRSANATTLWTTITAVPVGSWDAFVGLRNII